MAKAEPKMKENNECVDAFVRKVAGAQKQSDSFTLIELMKRKSGAEPKMWGSTIIGFGRYHYKYDSGHECDAPLYAFSPRSTSIVVYMSPEFDERESLLARLGKHKSSKGCIYIKKLPDIDLVILERIIEHSARYVMEKYE